MACAIAGHRGEETQQVAALAAALAQSDESSVIGGDRLSLAGATMLNGYLVTAVTMCDVHRPTLTHITPEVMPPALAIAERDGLSGRDLLVAIAAGCEVTTRVGIGLDYPAFRAKGWHGPGVLGRSAPPRRSAGCAGSTPRPWPRRSASPAARPPAPSRVGTPTVKFHQCRGALSGLLAALLAEQKFWPRANSSPPRTAASTTPIRTAAETRRRHRRSRQALGARADRAALWPSASSIQGMNTALFDLVEQHEIDPDQVKKVRVA